MACTRVTSILCKDCNQIVLKVDEGLFSSVSSYEDDLKSLENSLESRDIDYRIFSTSIPLQSAKWTAPEEDEN